MTLDLNALIIDMLSKFGSKGALLLGLGALAYLLFRQFRMHRVERNEWADRFDALQQQSLETIDKNTKAMTRLVTIIGITKTNSRGR